MEKSKLIEVMEKMRNAAHVLSSVYTQQGDTIRAASAKQEADTLSTVIMMLDDEFVAETLYELYVGEDCG